MSADISRILRAKASLRKTLGARPIEEKLEMLDQLRERAIELRESGDSGCVAEERAHYESRPKRGILPDA